MEQTSEAEATAQAVRTVFALGWQVAEVRPLLEDDASSGTAPALPLMGDLPTAAQRDQLVLQVRTTVDKLTGTLSLPDHLREPLDAATQDFLGHLSLDTLTALHGMLLSVLMASDFRLGKAYGLGVALSSTCCVPEGGPEEPWCQEDRVSRVSHYLADLHTVLPDHSAMAVLGSLTLWVQRAGGLAWEAAETLPEQGRTWRSLLSGEKSATQALSTADYLAGGRQAIKTGRVLLRRILGSPAFLLLGVFLLAVVLIVPAAVVYYDQGVTAAAAAALVGGGGGVGVGKKLWDGMETMWVQFKQPILDATLDLFIAAAITQLPRDEKVDDVKDLRSLIEASEFHPTGLPRR